MSEKDVKDNETEALNNDAAENADIEAGETDMATSIESVDFAVVYDDGGDSIATESAENAENTEGIATEDSVASDNANRVNETLALGATDDEQSLDQHETVQADSATSVSSQIDREIKHHRKKDAFFFKANPTFALDHVTVHNRKTGRNVLDDVSLAFHAGATHAVLVDAEDVEQHQALVATMVGMMRTTSGNVMHKSTNLADATPVDVLGHRIGFIPQRFAVRGDLDAEGNVLYAMDASNRNFLQPKPVIARELLKRVGFEEVTSGLPVGKMSALDQRRVAIARALSCEAEVIIADEPTTALDVTIQAQIMELMKEMKEKTGVSIMLITHDMGVVAEMADKIMVMYAAAREIFKDPKHPYTKGLLASIPRKDKDIDRLYTIEGTVPSLTSMPKGCRFCDRCTCAMEKCRNEQPPMYQFGERSVRCFLYEDKGGVSDER